MLEETLTKNLHLQQDLENMSQVKRTLILDELCYVIMTWQAPPPFLPFYVIFFLRSFLRN